MDTRPPPQIPLGAVLENCMLCPRLEEYRRISLTVHPDREITPYVGEGPITARLLIVGLAPTVSDRAILCEALQAAGMSEMCDSPPDRFHPRDVRIAYAVRCTLPNELAAPIEVATCNRFLRSEIHTLGSLRAVLALGSVAQAAVLKACGNSASRSRFRIGEIHALPDGLLVADCLPLKQYAGGIPALSSLILNLLQRLETD